MFHKIEEIKSLNNNVLLVRFKDGSLKEYDIKPLFDELEIFKKLKENDLFHKFHVSPQGYGVIWNDEIDLFCNELYVNGKDIKVNSLNKQHVFEEYYYQEPNPYEDARPLNINLQELVKYVEKSGKELSNLSEDEINLFL